MESLVLRVLPFMPCEIFLTGLPQNYYYKNLKKKHKNNKQNYTHTKGESLNYVRPYKGPH